MLGGDRRTDIDTHVLDDPRVTTFWDGDKVAGRWLADQQIGDLSVPGGVVWDAYLAFAPDAAWQTTPTALIASGTTIIDTTGGLRDRLVPLLG